MTFNLNEKSTSFLIFISKSYFPLNTYLNKKTDLIVYQKSLYLSIPFIKHYVLLTFPLRSFQVKHIKNIYIHKHLWSQKSILIARP